MPKPMIQWLVFSALALAWGSSFLFIKIGVTYVGPFTLVAGRFLIALVAIALLSWKQRVKLPGSLGRWLRILFLGLINLALPITLISWGEQTIDSSLAAVLNSIVPILTVALAHPLLADERLTRKKLLGVVLGFAGVVILVGLPTVDGNAGSPFAGSLAVAVASLSYALASIYVRRFLRDVPHTQLVLVSLVSALLTMTIMMLAVEGLPNRLHPRALLAMVWLGLVGTAFAYQLFYRLIAWWGAGRATTVTYTFPVVGVLLGIVFLGEALTVQLVVGGGLILAGVVQASRGRDRRSGDAIAVDEP